MKEGRVRILFVQAADEFHHVSLRHHRIPEAVAVPEGLLPRRERYEHRHRHAQTLGNIQQHIEGDILVVLAPFYPGQHGLAQMKFLGQLLLAVAVNLSLIRNFCANLAHDDFPLCFHNRSSHVFDFFIILYDEIGAGMSPK